MENKKFVRIQSQKTIQVTAGLNHQDNTNEDAHVPDRLKISSMWPKALVLIRAGAHLYPSEIVEWPTVKALEKDNIITIGAFVDKADEETELKKDELVRGLKAIGAYNEPEVQEEVKEEVKPVVEETKVETESKPDVSTLAEKLSAMRLSDIAK